jgi:hypothetical protein
MLTLSKNLTLHCDFFINFILNRKLVLYDKIYTIIIVYNNFS